jgi:hypothetical protein
MFCARGLVLCRTEGVGSCFQVLRSRNRFRLYRGSRVPFSCFARPDKISAVLRASAPVFMFCVPGLVLLGTEGVVSRFHVLRARTRLTRYRGRRVPFSCSALGLVLGGTGGVSTRFHVLLARPHFRRYRGCRHLFSCFARPNSVSTVPRASCPVFMFCAHRLVFGGTEGGLSRFHVLRARTRFRRYRGRRAPISCFARPDSFSAVLRASDPCLPLENLKDKRLSK